MAAQGAARRALPLLFEELPEPEGSPYLELPEPAEAPGQARYLLYYDELTGLFNRRLYSRRLEEELERAREGGTPLSVVWLNLDGFRRINEEYGHLQGDHVLARVGTLVREVVGKAGTPARFAGDDFVVLCPGLDRDAAGKLAGTILGRLRNQAFRLLQSPLTVQLTMSAGVASFDPAAAEPEALGEIASRAAVRAAREGGDRVHANGKAKAADQALEGRFPCPVLVGRDRALQDLEKRLTPEDRPQTTPPVVFLKGPAGIGKTRVTEALARRRREVGVRVLQARSRPETVGQPFATLLAALGDLLGREPRVRPSLLSVLHEAEREELERLLPELAPEGARAEHPTPVAEGSPLRGAFARMLGVLCENAPLLVILDDAQWTERTTLQVLKLLWSGHQANLSVCLVASTDEPEADLQAEAHPLREFLADLGGIRAVEEVSLSSLGPREVREMIEAILPVPPHEVLSAEVYRRSTGTPLLVEELLRFLLHSERMVLADGKVSLRDAEGIPSEGALAQARAAGLDAEIRTLLAHAAALGANFDLATLAAVDGRDEGYLAGLLERAAREDLVQAGQDGERFQFASEPLRRALYQEMADSERQEVHREIARTRTTADGGAGTRLSELAWHLRKAGEAGLARGLEQQLAEMHRRQAPASELSDLHALDDPRNLSLDRPLSHAEMTLAVEAARRLRLLMKSVRIYGIHHPEVTANQDEFLHFHTQLCHTVPRIDFSEARGVLIVNGQAPDSLSQKSGRLDLATNWHLQSLSFLPGLSMSEMKALTDALALGLDELKALGGLSLILSERGVTHVIPNERLFVEVGERDVLMRRTSDDGLVLVKDTAELEGRLDAMTGLSGEGLDFGRVAGGGGGAFPLTAVASGEGTAAVPLEELARLMSARQEVAAWYEEMSKYIDLSFVEALSADWGVLVSDLESGNRIKVAAAARTFLDRGQDSIYTLTQLLASSRDVRARKIALYLLRRLEHDVLPHLLTAVHATQSEEERPRLLECLEEFDAPAVVETLAAFVSHPEHEVRRVAIRVLENRSPQTLEKEVTNLLHRRGVHLEVVLDCLVTAGRHQIKELLPRLVQLCRPVSILFFDRDPRVQAQACTALGEIQEPGGVRVLVECVRRHFLVHRTKNPEVRAAAALALARFPSLGDEEQRVEKALARATRDKHRTVRAAAKLALARRKARRGEASPEFRETGALKPPEITFDDEKAAAPALSPLAAMRAQAAAEEGTVTAPVVQAAAGPGQRISLGDWKVGAGVPQVAPETPPGVPGPLPGAAPRAQEEVPEVPSEELVAVDLPDLQDPLGWQAGAAPASSAPGPGVAFVDGTWPGLVPELPSAPATEESP